MKNDLEILREKLDILLLDMPVQSPEALRLSQEIDIMIIDFYRKKNSN